MACTIFYKGEIKKDCRDAFFKLVPLYFKKASCDIRVLDDAISVEFLSGTSEPLHLSFTGIMLNGFCKWNGTDDQEFYNIFDFFIAAGPLFKTLDISDDEGAFHEYEASNKPCKVKFSNPSTMQEAALKQAFASPGWLSMTALEKEIAGGAVYVCSDRVLLLIIRDLIKLCKLHAFGAEDKEHILDLANAIGHGDMQKQFEMRTFAFCFIQILLAVWLEHTMVYIDQGRLKNLQNSSRDLNSSFRGAVFGIAENFLNEHGGTANSKHAQINKFIKRHHPGYWGLSQIDSTGEFEISLLISVLHFYGFQYVGTEDSDSHTILPAQ